MLRNVFFATLIFSSTTTSIYAHEKNESKPKIILKNSGGILLNIIGGIYAGAAGNLARIAATQKNSAQIQDALTCGAISAVSTYGGHKLYPAKKKIKTVCAFTAGVIGYFVLLKIIDSKGSSDE